jgi:hypothetical protein
MTVKTQNPKIKSADAINAVGRAAAAESETPYPSGGGSEGYRASARPAEADEETRVET